MRKADYNLLKLLYRIITLLVIVGLIIFVIYKCDSNKKVKKNKDLTIDKTENVIVEIKKVNEFVISSYYEEMVLHYSKKSSKLLDKRKDEIVILAKGKVRAGFDLQQIKQDDIQIMNDTLKVRIAKAKILDVIINPSDFEIYEEDGKWSQTLVSTIQSEASAKLKKHALDNHILEQADSIGKERLSVVLQSIGYNIVEIDLY